MLHCELKWEMLDYLNGKLKGNIDAELVLKSMTQYRVYKGAVIVTSDGDFAIIL